jgi:hypothetical protein
VQAAGERDLDRRAGMPDLDLPRGRDGVALQPQQRVGALAAADHDRQGDGGQHHGGDRDRRDGEDQPPSHWTSNR